MPRSRQERRVKLAHPAIHLHEISSFEPSMDIEPLVKKRKKRGPQRANMPITPSAEA